MNNVINVKEILNRIKLLKGFKTQVEIAEFLGITKGSVTNWVARNSVDFPLLMKKMPEVNLNWLFTGNGAPYTSGRVCNDPLAEGCVELVHNSKSVEAMDDRAVMLYDLSAAANLKTLLDNKNQYAMGKIMIPNIPKCDGAIFVSGDSMYPILKAGDIVGYKMISNFSSLIYGEMYIVAFNMEGDEYLSVKYVNRSEKEGHIQLVSYNPHHSPMDIPIDHITDMAIVKFSIRKNMSL